MTNTDSPNNGSTGKGFGIGLLIGGLAGIASYYLFGTKEGNKLKHKIIEEFELAKTNLPDAASEFLAKNKPELSPAISEVQAPNKNVIDKLLNAIKPNRTNGTDQVGLDSDESPKRFFTKSGRKLN
jgi:gas vesicle protein